MRALVDVQNAEIPRRFAVVALNERFGGTDWNDRDEIQRQKRAFGTLAVTLDGFAGGTVELPPFQGPSQLHGADENHVLSRSVVIDAGSLALLATIANGLIYSRDVDRADYNDTENTFLVLSDGVFEPYRIVETCHYFPSQPIVRARRCRTSG